MTKVTYEETMISFNEFYEKTVKGKLIVKKTGRKSKVELFLEQHRPPTFYELEKMWSEYSEDIVIICEERLLVYDEVNENELFEYDFETGDCIVNCESIDLIQSTLRFVEDRIEHVHLESQKE